MFSLKKVFFWGQFYALSLYSRTAVGALVTLLIARYSSVTDFGIFSSYRNIASFALMFANIGYADYILVSSKAKFRLVRQKSSLFIINAILLTVLISLLSLIFELDSHFLFILIVVRTFFDGVFFNLILPSYQASGKFSAITKINFLYSFVVMIIACVSYCFRLPLHYFLIMNIVVGIINFTQCSYSTRLNYKLCCLNLKRYLYKVDRGIFAYVGVTLAYYMYAQIPTLYVSSTFPKERAALYFSAFSVASIIGLLVTSQVQKIIPEMIKCKKLVTIQKIIRNNLIYIITVTSFLLFMTFIFGKVLLLVLYKQEYYIGAYSILIILMVGNILVGQAAVYGAFLTAKGFQKKKILLQFQASIITIVMLFILKKYELYGVAYAYLCGTVYISFSYTLYSIIVLKGMRYPIN